MCSDDIIKNAYDRGDVMIYQFWKHSMFFKHLYFDKLFIIKSNSL